MRRRRPPQLCALNFGHAPYFTRVTILEVIQRSSEFLAQRGVESPRLQIELLLEHALRLPRLQLYLNFERTLTEKELATVRALVKRRGQREPLQHLLGSVSFCGLEIAVNSHVLIPRPETESIIDIAVAASNSLQHQGIWVDLGTGSGAISIGLAKMLAAAEIYAIDTSIAALEIARINATRLEVIDRIHFSQGSWWSSLGDLKGKVTAMLSNPPYIPSQEVLRLQPEVVNHEPHLALDGGLDGLDAIRILVDTAPEYLQPGGIWLIEMMAGQGTAVVDLLNRQGSYTDIEIIDDLAGLDRFVLAKLRY